MNDFKSIDGKVFIKAILRDYYPKIARSIKYIEKIPDSELHLFGNAIFYLFNLSTCKYGCSGGEHQIESFAGRVYNHTISSIYLISLGFYDESLSLTRTIGEINNLISLFIYDYPNSFNEWINCDKKTRRKKFSPSEVRIKLDALNFANVIPICAAEYGDLSELYIHANTNTRPNVHNTETKRAFIGGIEQEEGFEKSYEILSTQVVVSSMLIARALNKGFLVEEINKMLKEVKE